jgi:hypothetical protein
MLYCEGTVRQRIAESALISAFSDGAESDAGAIDATSPLAER